jgi:hypothetical protein
MAKNKSQNNQTRRKKMKDSAASAGGANGDKYDIYVQPTTNLKTTKSLKLIVTKKDGSSISYYIIDENDFTSDKTWNEIKNEMNGYIILEPKIINPASFLAAINSLS